MKPFFLVTIILTITPISFSQSNNHKKHTLIEDYFDIDDIESLSCSIAQIEDDYAVQCKRIENIAQYPYSSSTFEHALNIKKELKKLYKDTQEIKDCILTLMRRTGSKKQYIKEVTTMYEKTFNNLIHPKSVYLYLRLSPSTPLPKIQQHIQALKKKALEIKSHRALKILRQIEPLFRNKYTHEEYNAFLKGTKNLLALWEKWTKNDRNKICNLYSKMIILGEIEYLQKTLDKIIDAHKSLINGASLPYQYYAWLMQYAPRFLLTSRT